MRVLRVYGWVFLIAGVVFVARPGSVLDLVDTAASILPGTRPLAGRVPSLWLGLGGAMMAVLAYVTFALARQPAQRLGWNVLQLSKACSTLLFTVFAATEANTALSIGAVVDGAILAHLVWLRRRLAGGSGVDDAWRPRLPWSARRGYEVWFLELDERESGVALWLRYTLARRAGGTAGACWYVRFDPVRGEVASGRWEEPVAEPPSRDGAVLWRGESASLERRRARAGHGTVRWDLSWEPVRAGGIALVPEFLFDLGIAGSCYVVPMSEGRVRGEVEIDGRRHRFDRANVAAGHLWGMRMADGWRWAHAVLRAPDGDEEVVFEILSARSRIGPLRSPWLTFACLWQGDGVLVSNGPWVAWRRNHATPEGEGFRFRAVFAGVVVHGRCEPAGELSVELDYEDPGGRRLRCRHSRTGTMRLVVESGAGAVRPYEAVGTAAVESVESL